MDVYASPITLKDIYIFHVYGCICLPNYSERHTSSMLPPYMKFSTSARGTSPPRNAGTYHIYGHSFAVMDVYGCICQVNSTDNDRATTHIHLLFYPPYMSG
ncbi:hypothetical protein Syun_011918 [Stephania yunnanensis]|uniref:Uncharacterized protein n=1 Tax=Stephania yunnanensis TaxID=152371 RepID=A0AAP0JZQ8_9MAGN